MIHLNIAKGLKRQLASLTGPIFIETLLIMTLCAVDTVMLSRHSDASVAAVGVVNQIVMLCFLVFEVINLGTSVLVSQYIGARLNDRVEKVVGVSLLVNLVIGLAISAMLYFGATTILRLMGLNDLLLGEGRGYMRIVGAFAFFQALSLTASAALRASNRAIYPMVVVGIVNILNIAGNYILIFGRFGAPALGAEGAAISTATSRAIAMVILNIILFHTVIKRFPWEIFRRFPTREFSNLLKIGLPSAGEQFSYSSAQIVMTFFHQHARRRSACRAHIRGQYHDVRLSFLYRRVAGRCHHYRSSCRQREDTRGVHTRKICHASGTRHHRHPFSCHSLVRS